MSAATGSSDSTPVLRIVTPDATPEEIAAIVAVFSAMGGAAAPAKKPVPVWAANARRVRPQHPHGPGGWRASGLPR
ncbi:MAG: acyl-CoA carboxylase subunit epsilon [Propionibacteriales bacterium]|nr:acyl-CoA carboxylase subunit epsilon [Propionibacteriales bacterium]